MHGKTNGAREKKAIRQRLDTWYLGILKCNWCEELEKKSAEMIGGLF